jgi:hypothetical protein
MPITRKEFESSSILHGDINNFIERIWSEERYREAINAFQDAIVIHDISLGNSVVFVPRQIDLVAILGVGQPASLNQLIR